MNADIIRVEGLGKRYTLGASGESTGRYRTLRESVTAAVRAPWRRRANAGTARSEEFWALRDVNFAVRRGEVVGIIGRNGAGKSTLLKILSRITEPTEGRVTLGGRVASLLEVGTGFHPELTGRENIFLNGAILGMSRAEIKAKFDEIVAFAEVERFVDTPVKRYSSGMYVRLAFAVAAHLEPEILIVDEVLAVGDTEFQKKCLGKMKEVSEGEGRTVLFVSHNLGAVTQLCGQAIHLAAGRVINQGGAVEVVGRYLEQGVDRWTEKTWTDLSKAPGDAAVRLVSVRAADAQGATLVEGIDVRQPVEIEVRYQVMQDGAIFAPSLHLHTAEGAQIFLAIDLEKDWVTAPRAPGLYRSAARIPGNFLNVGMHYVSVAISRLDFHTLHLFEQQVVAFNVNESNGNDTARGIFAGSLPGAIRPILAWQTTFVSPRRTDANQAMKSVLQRIYHALVPGKIRYGLHLARRLEEYTLVRKADWNYGEDNLYTFNTAPFLSDARFLRAYQLGEQTQSWPGGNIRWRAYIACWAGQQAAKLPGDFVECGVNRGGLARAIVDYTAFQSLDKRFYLVDNFTGLVPEYLNAAEREKNLLEHYRYYEQTPPEQVAATFAAFPNVQIIKGNVPDVLPQVPARSLAFVSLDMNCTLPEIEAAKFFWDRLVPGGIILLDDYTQSLHSEQQTAFDQFARERGVGVLALPTGQGLLLKP